MRTWRFLSIRSRPGSCRYPAKPVSTRISSFWPVRFRTLAPRFRFLPRRRKKLDPEGWQDPFPCRLVEAIGGQGRTMCHSSAGQAKSLDQRFHQVETASTQISCEWHPWAQRGPEAVESSVSNWEWIRDSEDASVGGEKRVRDGPPCGWIQSTGSPQRVVHTGGDAG